jgi:hypothetical protein
MFPAVRIDDYQSFVHIYFGRSFPKSTFSLVAFIVRPLIRKFNRNNRFIMPRKRISSARLVMLKGI